MKCKDVFTRVVDKSEELFDLAKKTEDLAAAFKNFEKWFQTVTKKTNEFISAAREYINSVRDKETAEQCTPHHSRSGSHMTMSKRTSQHQWDLEISRLKREELEKQHEAELRIARQRLEIKTQTQLRNLEKQQHEEEQSKQIAAAAAPEENELMTKPSSDGSRQNQQALYWKKFSQVQKTCWRLCQFVTGREHGRCCKWTEFAFFWFHRQIQQSNFPRPSSTRPLNSHSNLNTDGQVEA